VSMHKPNVARFLDPPLHRIAMSGRIQNGHRILYREKSTGDWMVWRAFALAAYRDNVYRIEVEKYPKIQFVRQSFENSIHPGDLKEEDPE